MYFLVYIVLSILDSFRIYLLVPYAEQRVQAIFNKVIDSGHYTAEWMSFYTSQYMCGALDHAYAVNVITKSDLNFAKNEIRRYLEKQLYLSARLNKLNRDSRFTDRLAIYKDWKSRPFTALEK